MDKETNPITIAVASGKGGTGKTTITLSLALSMVRVNPGEVLVCDCDVEAPNLHLFLQPIIEAKEPVNQLIPEADLGLCKGHGKCAEVCRYNAIIKLKGNPVVFPDLCHGCGSCTLICPEGALHEIPRQIGMLEHGVGREGLLLKQGLLNIGEPLAVPVIAELKRWKREESPFLELVDCPPGASCPMVEAISGADFVLLVTEPTPFGLHDLKAAYEVTRKLNIPAGVVINRTGLNGFEVEEYCRDNNLPVLMKIPLDINIGQKIAQGKTLLDVDGQYQSQLLDLIEQVNCIIEES